jgi:hypothetical protein
MLLIFLRYAVAHNSSKVLPEKVGLYFVQQQVFELVTVLGYTSPTSRNVPMSERDFTPLQYFYKGCTQSNQQLSLSPLMHTIHCGSAVLSHQVLDRRRAQETSSFVPAAKQKIVPP